MSAGTVEQDATSSPGRRISPVRRGATLSNPQQPRVAKGRRLMLKTLPALAALAVATALVVPTISQAAERTSVRVSYADLNLATEFGQTKLQRRISFAAELVCDTTDPLNLAIRSRGRGLPWRGNRGCPAGLRGCRRRSSAPECYCSRCNRAGRHRALIPFSDDRPDRRALPLGARRSFFSVRRSRGRGPNRVVRPAARSHPRVVRSSGRRGCG